MTDVLRRGEVLPEGRSSDEEAKVRSLNGVNRNLCCRSISVGVATAVGIVAVAIWLKPSDEPSYQGRRLSEWLDDLVERSRDPEAVSAVRSIGTNAVPHLLRGFSYKSSAARAWPFNAANRLLRGTLHIRRKPFYEPAQLRYLHALCGFDALGSMASNAVPALSAFLDTPNTGHGAALSLSDIGLAALAAFVHALTNGSPTARCHSLVGICHLGAEAGPALPVVLGCLQDTNVADGGPVRDPAIMALGNMRLEADQAVSALTNLLKDANYVVRMFALQSLGKLGIEASCAIPAVTGALTDFRPEVRFTATNALRAIAQDQARPP